MKNAHLAILAVVLFGSILSAQSGIELKQMAIDGEVSKYINATPQGYDNFIAGDGNEYVIVSIDQTPSFLIRVEKTANGYEAWAVRDNSTIENVIKSRYSKTMQNKSLGQVKAEVSVEIAKFNESRFLHEAKYNLILGLGGKYCQDIESCRESCLNTEVCKYAYEREGNKAIEDVLAYSMQKKELDRLILMQDEIAQNGEESQLEALNTYSDILAGVEKTVNALEDADVQREDNFLYSGPIGYNREPIAKAKEIVKASLAPARFADSMQRSIKDIQTVTSLRVPESSPEYDKAQGGSQEEGAEGEADEKGDGQSQSIYENAAAPGREEWVSPPVQKVEEGEERQAGYLDLIIKGTAAVILIVSFIQLVRMVRRYLKEKGGKPKGLMEHQKHRHGFAKKEKYSLEDLT